MLLKTTCCWKFQIHGFDTKCTFSEKPKHLLPFCFQAGILNCSQIQTIRQQVYALMEQLRFVLQIMRYVIYFEHVPYIYAILFEILFTLFDPFSVLRFSLQGVFSDQEV